MKKAFFLILFLFVFAYASFALGVSDDAGDTGGDVKTSSKEASAKLSINLSSSSFTMGFSSSPMNSNIITPEAAPTFTLKNVLTNDYGLQGELTQGYIYVFWKIASFSQIQLKLKTSDLKSDNGEIEFDIIPKNKFGKANYTYTSISSGNEEATVIHEHESGFDDWGCIGFSVETKGNAFGQPAGNYVATMTMTMETKE